jgi:hypothetical protein
MMTNTKMRHRKMTNAPATWAADLTRPAVDAANLGAIDLTRIATNAASSCRPAETGGGDTVATPASNGRHAADGPSVSLSASPDTAAIRLPIPNVSRACEQCGRGFTPRRRWGRFCSAYCRRVAWLGRNPERAAELAERDRARLRAHVIGNDGEWVEGAKVR